MLTERQSWFTLTSLEPRQIIYILLKTALKTALKTVKLEVINGNVNFSLLLIWLYVLERQSNSYAVMPPPDVDGFSNNEEAFAKSSIQPGYGSSKDANDVI